MNKLVGLVVIALLIFFVIAQPDAAANSLQNILATLRDAAQAVVRFFTNLV